LNLAGILPPLGLLALLLIAVYPLHTLDYVFVISGTGVLVGWRFVFVLAFFYLTAVLSSLLPRHRRPILLAAALIQLFVLYTPLKAAGSLIIWIAFYFLVHLDVSWRLKSIAMAGLYAAPFVLLRVDPESGLIGILAVMFFSTNFVLRSAMYAYEATTKGDELRRAGLPGYLLYLIAPPLAAVKLAPIGFLVLHRGLRTEASPRLMFRGIGEIGLGVAYLAAREYGHRKGILPNYLAVAGSTDQLNALTALAASHLLLLRLFLLLAGHIHIAVGMMRVLGFDIPPGTRAPHLSRNVLDFWRRWNVYYRDYVMTLGYYPVVVALKRHPYWAVAAGGLVTFLLSGFAHTVQVIVRRPGSVSFERLLELNVWPVAYGALVVAWMLLESVRGRRKRPRFGVQKKAPLSLWRAGWNILSIAVTLTVISLVLLLLLAPIHNHSLSTALDIYAALFRIHGLHG
jgi:hypothetical protein